MTKNKTQFTETTILPMNYKAIEYLSWFTMDSQNLQGWAGSVFRGGFDSNNPEFLDLLNAANNSIKEVEDDIVKLKEFLAAYVPSNK